MKRFILVLLLFYSSAILNAQKADWEDFNKMAIKMAEGPVQDISVDSLAKDLEQYILLDCREREEYAVSHLPGAYRVGFDDFELKKIPEFPKNAKIITYCTVGWRSEKIGAKLQKAGFTKVQNLKGSILEWVNKENPVVDLKGNKTDSVHTFNRSFSKYALKGIPVY